MTHSVDLNADMGESFGPWVMGRDADLLEIITSANIACGMHAGDWDVMAETMTLAKTRNVGIGASCVRRADIEMRDEIGLDSIMWGSDFPHPEGTWPNTGKYYKETFSGIPEEDGRKILGGNAVEFYGLDHDKLRAVALERVSPARPSGRSGEACGVGRCAQRISSPDDCP